MDADVLDRAEHLTLNVDAEDVRTASAWLESVSYAHGVPSDQIYRLDLCLNEVLANIIAHGGETATLVPLQLALEVKPGNALAEATLTIADAGRAYNPLTVAHKLAPLTLADATPGGLGLTMLSHFSDAQSYRYHAGRNHLTITVHWTRS